MLYFIKVLVKHENISPDQLWDIWEKEADVAEGAMKAGKIVAAYKVVGQRRVVAIFDVESHDELDQVIMAGLPMSHILEWEEIVPVRPYSKFADDVRRRWK